MTCASMFALKVDANNHHMQTSHIQYAQTWNSQGFLFFLSYLIVLATSGARISAKKPDKYYSLVSLPGLS